MKTNIKKTNTNLTHEGARTSMINPEQELKRSMMAYMLFEDQFYESGIAIADRIKLLVKEVDQEKLEAIVIEAREKIKLRHAPLFLCRCMASEGKLKAGILSRVIQRADEITEFMAIYWSEGKCPISNQVKKGLAIAFGKFNEYEFSKYNRNLSIKLKDVLFMVHAKPHVKQIYNFNIIRGEKPLKKGKYKRGKVLRHDKSVFNNLKDDTLSTPDTWEVNLSSGADKKETWERLINENKLGGLAFLRNMRNMVESGLSREMIIKGLNQINTERILPFRFITAARYAVDYEADIEPVMFKCLEGKEKLPGKTILIIDVSGSMYGSLISGHSELDRAETACSLAILVREICENPVIYATAGSDAIRVHKTEKVPARRGFALSDVIYNMCKPLGGGGIFLKQVMDYVYQQEKNADRIIIITDEQDCGIASDDHPSKAKAFGKHNYIINVASFKNGIAYEKFVHINGWSESIIDYIIEYEKTFY